MGIDQPPRAADPSRLLVGEHREDEVARRPAAGLGANQGSDHHRHTALHVERAAAPQVAVDDVAAEGTVAPVLVDRGDDVDVALEEQRRGLAPTLHPRDEVGAARFAFVSLAFDVRVAEQLFDKLDRKVLFAWRVRGVEPDEVAGQLDHERKRRHHLQAS